MLLISIAHVLFCVVVVVVVIVERSGHHFYAFFCLFFEILEPDRHLMLKMDSDVCDCSIDPG